LIFKLFKHVISSIFSTINFVSGTEGVGSSFYVLRSRTHFQRYQGRIVQFSCCVLPDSFSAVPRVPSLVFMFYALVLVFGGTEGAGFSFHVLCSRIHFRWYRGRRVQFSCFAFADPFWAVPRASSLVFMFCAPRLIFDGTKGIRSSFHVLRFRTRFGGTEGIRSSIHVFRSRTHFGSTERRVQFSCFALLDSFSAVPRAQGPVFMLCAPGLIFGSTRGCRVHFS
jgi:hypothetical protein